MLHSSSKLTTLALGTALALLGQRCMAQVPAENPKAILEKATQDLVDSGLAAKAIKSGQQAPDFALPNILQVSTRLVDLLKKGPVVLTFYRGGWCPFCNLQLKSYQEKLPEMRALGAELVAISPQLPDGTVSTVEKDALTFEVLSDVGNKVAREYGLVFKVPDEVVAIYKGFGINLEKANGDSSHELPMPGTFVIGKDGKVLLASVEADYKKRLPVERILDALKALKK